MSVIREGFEKLRETAHVFGRRILIVNSGEPRVLQTRQSIGNLDLVVVIAEAIAHVLEEAFAGLFEEYGEATVSV
jgi:hypothetical protein